MENALREFVQIVESGSVSAAARELDIPRASLGRRLLKMEETFGIRLIHRDSHTMVPTRAGQELYRRARGIVTQIDEAKRAVGAYDDSPTGLLRVGLPPSTGLDIWIAKEYLARYPNVELEFIARSTHDDLFKEQIDVALRVGSVVDERLIARKITSFRNLVYASPELVESIGTPDINSIRDYPCVTGFDAIGRPIRAWPKWDGGVVDIVSKVRTNSIESQRDAALQGLGLAMLSERWVRPDVDAGRLVPLWEETVGTEVAVSLVWTDREFMSPKVRAFVELVSEIICDKTIPAKPIDPAPNSPGDCPG